MDWIRRVSREKVLPLLKILHVEPFLLFFVLSDSTRLITQAQFLQDKLCLDVFNQTREFCYHMNDRNLTNDESLMKSQVLSTLSEYRFYEMLVYRLTRLLWPLFLGSWSDKYVHGRKVMMAAASFGMLLELVMLLVASLAFEAVGPLVVVFAVLPTGLVGGYLGIFIGAYSYIGKNTPPHLLGVRFALVEVFYSIAWPAGTYLGGLLLDVGVSYTGGQLRTYSYVFATALVFNAVAFLWVVLAINERKLKPVPQEVDLEDGASETQTVACRKASAGQVAKVRNRWKPVKLLFDLSNVVEMWRAVSKKRPDGNRLHIWLMTAALATHVFVHSTVYELHFQFVQKVYNWNSVFYSVITTYESIFVAVAMLVGYPVLEKLVRVPLPQLAVFGSLASVVDFVLCGFWLVPTAYYIAMSFYAVSGFSTIVLRTVLVGFLPPLEIGKVFSFLELVKALMPMASSAIFTPVFMATIDTNVGLSYQICAGLSFIQVAIFVYMYWVHRRRKRPDRELKQIEAH